MDNQFPWQVVIVAAIAILWMAIQFYRVYFRPLDESIVRFEVDERVFDIVGPSKDVIKAHYDVFHGRIDHRNQARVQDWEKPIWWTLFLTSEPWRREVHVVRAEQFDEAVNLLLQAKNSGLKIDVIIRPMTNGEARTTRNAESNREHELFDEGRISHPRDRAWLWGFVGPKRDKIRKAPMKPIQKTDLTIIANTRPRDRRPHTRK